MDRERQILEAAAALFYDKGFHGVGVDQIGERVGISGPALYRHFAGKDEILATLFNEAIEELIGATTAVYSDPHRDLERIVRHHVEFAIDHRHLVNVYQREEKSLVEPWRSHFLRRQRQYALRWQEALRRCFPDAREDQVTAASHAAIGMIHSVAHWPRAAPTTAELDNLLYRLVTTGLAALEDDAGAGDGQSADAAPEAQAPSPARRSRQRSSGAKPTVEESTPAAGAKPAKAARARRSRTRAA